MHGEETLRKPLGRSINFFWRNINLWLVPAFPSAIFLETLYNADIFLLRPPRTGSSGGHQKESWRQNQVAAPL